MIGDSTPRITWRIHLEASPEVVYRFLSTDEGRARFWADSTHEEESVIHFRFPNGQTWEARILKAKFPVRYAVEYLGGSTATFELVKDGRGGTDLTLTDAGVDAEHHAEISAGWVSVLLCLKAAVDFGIDLRNHDERFTWDQGYVDN